jgi:hypothetical protein
MTIFRASKEHKKILEFLKKEGILNDVATFQCYCDLMFDFSLLKHGKSYYFTILAEDENFVREQSIDWLMDLKRVYYFEFRCDDFKVVFNLNKDTLN